EPGRVGRSRIAGAALAAEPGTAVALPRGIGQRRVGGWRMEGKGLAHGSHSLFLSLSASANAPRLGRSVTTEYRKARRGAAILQMRDGTPSERVVRQ
ncbi:hypothetical protein DMX10_24520, partial [Pseudomonas sp. 57B-090624]